MAPEPRNEHSGIDGVEMAMMRERLCHVYGKLRDAIAPGLRYSQLFYEDQLRRLVGPTVDWLDLGCGHHVLPPWRGDAERTVVGRCRSVTGIDYDLPSL